MVPYPTKNLQKHIEEDGCLVVYLDLPLQTSILSRFKNNTPNIVIMVG